VNPDNGFNQQAYFNGFWDACQCDYFGVLSQQIAVSWHEKELFVGCVEVEEMAEVAPLNP
jgi:hypothetical protein